MVFSSRRVGLKSPCIVGTGLAPSWEWGGGLAMPTNLTLIGRGLLRPRSMPCATLS
jgi:hypothetical protein